MSLAVLADHMASKGRGPDSMLIHMSPTEVQGLQALAMRHGGSLTINPETGLPEAGFLDKLLPAIIGFAITATTGIPAWQVGLGVGAVETARTGDLGRGISAGLGAYGGAGMGASMGTAGAEAIGSQATNAARGLTGDMAFNLADAGSSFSNALAGGETGILNSSVLSDEAIKGIQQQAAERVASASPFEKLSAGFDVAKANPSSLLTKDNFKYMAAAAAPILADQAVKSNLPTTTTKPGYIRPYSFDPYGGTYTAGTPYEAMPTRAAGGGLMGMNDGGYNPGQLDFTQESEPVVRMAKGGIAGYAAGGVPDYFIANPDVAKAYTENTYGLNPEQFAYVHAEKYGNAERASGQRAPTTQSAGAAYAAANGIDLQKNINDWVVNNPFATAADVTNALAGSGLTQTDVNPYLTANTSISDAQRYALSHIDEIDGLSGLQKGVLTALARNPNMTQSEIDAAQAQYGLSNYDIQSPLIQGYQVASDQTAAAQKYLQDNPDVARWISSDEGKAYIKANPQFDASDIAYTHFQRYGEGEGRKWGLPTTTVVSTCPAPDMRILLANGSLKAAGDLQIGDVIRTQHETTLAWGDHPVTHVSIVPNVPRLKIEFGDVKFVCSLDHKFFKAAGEWVTAKDVVLGDMLSGHTVRSLTQADIGDVVRITVDDAHTYICEGLLSHNKSPQGPVVTPPTTYVNTPLTYVNTPTDIDLVDRTALPPGVSGAGITTVNPNGTITTRPNIPGIPEGGFTGMKSLRDAYTAGGGSLGYIPYAPKTMEEFNTKYGSKLTGGSKQAYDYLTGKTLYDPTPYTKTGEIMKPYFESVGRFPENRKAKKYVFVDGKYQLNPDYVKPSYVLAAEKAAVKDGADTKDATTPADLTDQSKPPTTDPGSGNEWLWDYAGKKWYASPIQVAAAGGLMAMARGGMAQQFDLGGYSDGGRLLRGPGDGVSDSIPATIGNKRPARLADGEFVVPARIVSELGNGSTEAGARKLYAMMDRVQAARKGSIGKGKVAKNSRADKYLPA